MKDMLRSSIFDLKNIFTELGNPFYRSKNDNFDFNNDLSSLKKDGVLIKKSFFDENLIDQINYEIDKKISKSKFTKFNKVNNTPYNCVNHQPFTLHDNFIDFALNQYLINIIKSYFKREKIFLSDASFEILAPSDINEGSYKWHYDLRGLQIKAMVLLTDVDINGQYFTYVKGSQCFRSSLNDKKSRYSNEYVDKLFPKNDIINCVSKKGSLIIFDSRGLHKGTRQNTYERKNLTINFKPNKFYKQEMIIDKKHQITFQGLGIKI